MKVQDILSEINENSKLKIKFDHLTSLTREIVELENYRYSVLYTLYIGESKKEISWSLTREFIEDLKGYHRSDFENGKSFEDVYLTNVPVSKSTHLSHLKYKIEILRAAEKELYRDHRELRLKNILNK